ncbi:MAG TPA: protein kinase, partial [Blastocatellia bacterium]|nr:protein kinase [Blastocatellia bacterium]
DAELQAEIASLLAHEVSSADWLVESAPEQFAAILAGPRATIVGRRLGRYVPEALLGAGGMGEVWRAYDTLLDRAVALKLLPPALAADATHVRRFQQEALAASALNHPNIITVYEIGEADGRHFIAVELVAGRTLRERLHAAPPDWREAVFIAAQIASALDAAHRAGIIHRDIKPENVMTLSDNRVKVLDFGIAKLIGERAARAELKGPDTGGPDSADSPNSLDKLTRDGLHPGTERYMSPEQARGETLDGRSDLFSLGVVLYELILGQRPYGDLQGAELLARLTGTEEIPSLAGLCPDLPAALVRIAARALRKRREERYAEASAMKADLNELLALLPVSEQTEDEKLIRVHNANRLLTQAAVRSQPARLQNQARVRLPLSSWWMIWRYADLPRGRTERAVLRRSVWGGLWRLGALFAAAAMVALAAAAWLSVQETFEEELLRDGHTAAVRQIVFSPDGTLLVSVSEDKRIIVWDFARRAPLATLTEHQAEVTHVAFAPDGKRFATLSRDGAVIVWDAARREKLAEWRDAHQGDNGIAFSPDGRWLAHAMFEGGLNKTVLRETTHGERTHTLDNVGGRRFLFTPNSRQLLLGDYSVYDTQTGRQLTTTQDEGTNWLALAPDATRLAGINSAGEVLLYQLARRGDFTQRKLLRRERAHDDHGRSVEFSPDGRLLASAAEHIVLWNAATMQREAVLKYSAIVWSVVFSPDGRWLVSAHADGSILVWDVRMRDIVANFNQHGGPVRAVAFSPNGKHIAGAGDDRSAIVWNATTGRKEAALSDHDSRLNGVAFTPDGQSLAVAGQDRTIKLLDVARRELQWQANYSQASGYCVAVSPDGRWVATTFGVYERATGRQLAGCFPGEWGAIYGVAFSADGRRLVCVTENGSLLLWDTDTWRLLARQQQAGLHLITVSFAPDGQTFVTGEDEGAVRLWRAETLEQLSVLGKHEARIKSVAFSPDGTQVVSAGDDKMIALWDVARRRLVTRIGLHTAPVYAVAFSPDGRQLVSGGHDHSVRLYTRRRSLWGRRWMAE